MAIPDGLHIQRMIIHKVDHVHVDRAQFSEIEPPVSDSVRRFLCGHIQNSRDHRFSRIGRFLEPTPDVPCLKSACDTLLANPGEFVPQSQAIAQRLYDTSDNRMSPGDLILCSFTEGDSPLPWLAILKLDPSVGFVGEREKVDGKVCFVLRSVPDVLPSGELQKCAFILPLALRKERGHDLKILDQQIGRYGARRMVASFFTQDFLACRVGLNQADATRVLVYGSFDWIRQKEGLWASPDIEQFKNAVTNAIREPLVDAANLATSLITNDTERDDYLGHLRREGLEELVFEPDLGISSRFRYVHFEGDNGLKVRIEAGAFSEGKTLVYETDPDTNVTTVTIKTIRWAKTLG